MPTLSEDRQAYLDAGDYTDAYCVRIVRADGEVFRFTSYHRDLEMTQKFEASVSPQISALSPKVTYKANTGYGMTAVQSTATLAIDNIDVMGIFENTGITKAELLAGLYDGAQVYIFLTNYQSPIEDEHPIKKAIYGITKLNDETFHVEFRGLTQLLQQEVGRRITILSDKSAEEEGAPMSPDDWATGNYTSIKKAYDWLGADVVKPTTPNGFWYYLSDYGGDGQSGASEPSWPTSSGSTVDDGQCTWTAFYSYKFTATVTAVLSRGVFEASGLSLFPDAWFTQGFLTWSGGDNTDLTMEVSKFQNGGSPNIDYRVSLFLDMPYTIQVGDTFEITVGYNRTFTQCINKFANGVNFGGFPHLPGPRTAGKYGGQ